jgi:uncharacterized glyoxalase superfamily protein PhnB
MTTNRAVPVAGVLPHLYYQDVDAAIPWLKNAFGFETNFIVPEEDGRVHTAQLRLENAYVMIRNERDTELSPATANAATQRLMVIVDDVDAHHERARMAGARITSDLTDHAYGEREYSTLDLEGHPWTFAQHVTDVDPIAMFGRPDQ